MLPPDIFPEQWTGTPRTVLGSRSRGSGRRERTAGAAAAAAHCALPQPVGPVTTAPAPFLNPIQNLLREHGARRPAPSARRRRRQRWRRGCAPPSRASIDGAPRPPGGCAPCRPARPSLATRARAPGRLERRRRAAGQPRPHPRARAGRRALRLAAHQTARQVAPQLTPTLALAMHLVRRERQKYWSADG